MRDVSSLLPRLLAALHYALQSGEQGWPLRPKLCAMMQRQIPQHFLSARSQFQQDLTPVLSATLPADKASRLEPVYEFYGAMVLNLQSAGQFADVRSNVRGQPLQGKHQLMLPRLQAGGASGPFAKVHKATDLVPELCQGLVIPSRKVLLHGCGLYRAPTIYIYRITM
jgi:hypothetical protein